MSLSYRGTLRNCSLIALVAASLTTFVHCTSESVASAESDHTSGNPTNENSAYSWVEADFASFKAASSTIGPGVELPPDSPITVRLQKWADAFDATARRIMKEEQGQELAAPRPVIVVFNSQTNNAWSSGARTCLGGPVDLSRVPVAPAPTPFMADGGAPPAVVAEAGAPVAVANNVMISGSSVFFTPGTCAEPTNWPSKEGAIGWLDRHRPAPDPRMGEPCRLEWKDGRPSVFGAVADAGPWGGCSVTSQGRPADTSDLQAVTNRTSQYIYFTTRYLQTSPDEMAVVTVIAHELSHLYKAHGSRHSTYDYFYEQKTPAVPGKPEPVADSADLVKRLHEVSPYVPAPIAGSIMSERLRPAIVNLVSAMQTSFVPARPPTAPPLHASCTNLYSEIAPHYGELTRWGAVPSELAAAKYLEVEKKFLACAVMTKVGPTDELTASNLRSVVGRWFAAGAAVLPVETRQADGGAATSRSLADIFGELQGKAKELDFDTAAFKAQVDARHLGIYTSEQEADDLSMELMVKTGLDANETIDGRARTLELRSKDPALAANFANDGITPQECLALYRAGWKKADANGVMQPVAIPLGNMYEPHHGYCYRIYNLSREREAHAPVTVGTAPTFETPWSEIRAAVDAALLTLPATMPAGPTTPPENGEAADIIDSY